MKIPALVGKKDFENVFKNSDTSFSSGPFVVILKKNKISSTRTGIIIQKKFVKLGNKIKTIGAYSVDIDLHPEVNCSLDIEILSPKTSA